MALGALQSIVGAGITPSYAAPGTSETITPIAGQFLHVKNTGATTLTVTITDAGVTPAGTAGTSPAPTVVGTTGDKMIYLNSAYASPTTGLITVTFSTTTSVTAALLRV